MFKAFSTRHNRNRSLVILMVCYVLAIAAATQGIGSDSPGLLLAFLSASYFVLAFVHHWRTSRKFLHLVYVSGPGYVLLTLLSLASTEIKSNIRESSPGTIFSQEYGRFLDFIAYIGADKDQVAILFLPVLLVGAVGAVVMFGSQRRHRRAHLR